MKEIKSQRTPSGGIRIMFMVGGQRYSLTPVVNGRFDNSLDYRQAQLIASTIACDLHAKIFDETLSKYKPKSLEDIEVERKLQNYDLLELWLQYTEARKNHISESTLSIGYAQVTRLLKEAESTKLVDAQKLKLWVLKNKPATFSKKLLMQLNACCKWGIEVKLIDYNPFQGYQKLLNHKTSQTENDIDPFDEKERELIISLFTENKRLNHYCHLVEFLFYIGCRPSEAIALTWADVEKNKVVFNKAFVNGHLSNRLKTEERRIINQNEKIKSILKNQRQKVGENGLTELNLVFPAPKGKNRIDWGNFSSNFWKKSIEKISEVRYRSPYQMRHSFITLSLKAGVSPQDIAKHCGNSADVIFRHYAGVSRGFTMPEI
jgi:integrase